MSDIKELLKNKIFILKAVKLNGLLLKYASDELKQDKEVVFEAFKNIGTSLEYAHNKIRELLLLTEKENIEITLYTDCKNFVDLITKRKDNDKIKAHRNYEFYKELFDLVAVYKTNVYWIKGHDKKDNKISPIQKIFSILDKKARQLVREIV